MNGQPSPNQGGIAQLAGGMGGMGSSPTLGGAPQTPPMPQGGAQKPPQQAPQGQLDPKLLDALSKIAALKVREEESKARARILASMNQGNEGTVVEQLDKQNMEATKKELVDKLSGGVKQAGQMSAQPQGQPQPSPMSGGIAAAPGANQAAQPEAMAAGGIVAFAGPEGSFIEGQDIPEAKELEEAKAALKSLSPVGTSAMARDPEGAKEKLAQYQEASERVKSLQSAYEKALNLGPAGANFRQNPAPQMIAANRPAEGGIPAALNQRPNEFNDTPLVRREDMRRDIANVQRPPVAAINQAPRPPAAAPTLPTAPIAPAGEGPTQPGILSVLSNAINIDPDAAERRGRESFADYNKQDPELVKQLAADTARVRATAESKGAAPTWQESLYAAMPKGRPQPGSSVFTTIGDAVGGINALELQRKGEKEASEKELLGMSKTALETSDKRRMEAYAAGERKAAQAVDILKSALPAGANIEGSRIQAAAQRATNMSNEKIHELDNIAKAKIAGLANKPTGLERIIERTSKESGIPYHVVAAAFVGGGKGATGPTAGGFKIAQYAEETFKNLKDPAVMGALKSSGAPDKLIADVQNGNIKPDSPQLAPFLDKAKKQFVDRLTATATPPARLGGATSYDQYPVD